MLDLEHIQSFYPEEIRPFRVNILREYLQCKILESVFRSKHGSKLSFMGGTCIHLVHGSPRFSEDLDFDNRGLSPEQFDEVASFVQKDLQLEGYTVELKTAFIGAYHGYFRFPSILYESGLTGHREQKLLIEMDTEPQQFEYGRHSVLINKFEVLCRVQVVPADILLSQKYLCIISRKRPMGRDFYDAGYLMGKTGANLLYLKDKLGIKNFDELKARLLARCKDLSLHKLAADVEPFLVNPRDAERVAFFPDLITDHLK